jgi:hypothetical protein
MGTAVRRYHMWLGLGCRKAECIYMNDLALNRKYVHSRIYRPQRGAMLQISHSKDIKTCTGPYHQACVAVDYVWVRG